MDQSDDEAADVDDDTDVHMSAIDEVVVDTFIEVMDSCSFEPRATMFLKLFVRMLSQRLLARTQRPRMKDILENHIRGKYEINE